MFLLITKSFLRSASVNIGLAFLLLAGIVSLFVGKQFLERQKKNVAETSQFQREEIARNVQFHKDEIGLLLYYVQFGIVNETHPINGLAIGQRDLNPSVQRVTIRGLEAQKYDADLANPGNALLGNLDFSFVLIYLFPLLIIAFTYNLVSGERENGTWRIVAVQSNRPDWFVIQLFLVRFLFIISALLLIFGLAIPLLGLPLDGAFWVFVGTSVLYVLFWFGLSFWVTSLGLSSSVNAVWLVTAWLVLIVILPASLNAYLLNRYPTPEAYETMVTQRKGYHEKWDMPKQPTVAKFFAHYPQFKNYPPPNSSFDWLWYYAMQQMGDDESAKQATELREKLQLRESVSRLIGYLLPTVHTQVQLNDMAKSGLANQLRFLDATTQFHEQKRLFFYPRIFENVPVKNVDWNTIRVDTFRDDSPVSATRAWLPLLGFVMLLLGLGWQRLKQGVYFD